MASRNGFFIKNTLYIYQVSCIICNEVSSDFEVDSFLDHVFISFLTGRLHGTQLVSFKKKKKRFLIHACGVVWSVLSVPIFLVSVTYKPDAVPRIRINGISPNNDYGNKVTVLYNFCRSLINLLYCSKNMVRNCRLSVT